MLNPSCDHETPLEDCIYEAQASCIVTGFDERSWVALAFVDTYYKGESNRESVEYIAEQPIFMDPLACGQIDANLPI